MPGSLVHDGRHGTHRFHLGPVSHPFPRSRAQRSPLAIREARAVTALVAVATAVFSVLWICAAVGLADASWWRVVVVGCAVAFASAAIASLHSLRNR